jgi:hypothetical protein
MSQESIDYPKGLTFEQVWAGIQELGKKYDAIFEREAKERQEREEREAKERREREERETKERQEREERMRKLEEEVNKTTITVNRLGENMGGLSNRFGEMVEHLVAPNIFARFNELGYNFTSINRKGIEIYENGQFTEVDILLENGKTVAVVEVKSKPNRHDIRRHIKRMQIVRNWFCERYGDSNKEFIGAVAGAVFPDSVKQFTIETGFYVITQTGDTVKIDVPENFKPRIF